MIMYANFKYDFTIWSTAVEHASIAHYIRFWNGSSVQFFNFRVDSSRIGIVEEPEDNIIFNICVALVTGTLQLADSIGYLGSCIFGIAVFQRGWRK